MPFRPLALVEQGNEAGTGKAPVGCLGCEGNLVACTVRRVGYGMMHNPSATFTVAALDPANALYVSSYFHTLRRPRVLRITSVRAAQCKAKCSSNAIACVPGNAASLKCVRAQVQPSMHAHLLHSMGTCVPVMRIA